MFQNKSFQIALVISLILHSTIFFKLPYINLFAKRRSLKQVELSYIDEKEILPSLKLYKQEFPQKPSYQTSSKSVAPAPNVKNEQIFKNIKDIPIIKPEPPKPEIITVKKKITLPLVSDEKINNPVYLNYYQIVREKIKRAAYKNYTHLVNGEVYLSFIILNDGQLTDIRINHEKSSAYDYLKEVAEKSINDASPFPSFPKELGYPKLSFNVIISFETE